SRRRHTRSKRDWSSDVCSSDLPGSFLRRGRGGDETGSEAKMLIGEVARRSGVSARMLRHYESIGLLAPTERTAVGYREYADADTGRNLRIEGLRKLGMSLRGDRGRGAQL